MSRKTVDALTERYAGTTPERPPNESRASKPEPEGEKPRRDLNDLNDQDRILNPESTAVTLSYGDIVLYEPSIKMRRRIYGFVARLFVDAAALPGSSHVGLFGTRIASLLCSRDDLESELMQLVAKCMGKPGTVSDEQAQRLAEEMSERANKDDIAVLYSQLGIIARVNDATPDPPKRRRKD